NICRRLFDHATHRARDIIVNPFGVAWLDRAPNAALPFTLSYSENTGALRARVERPDGGAHASRERQLQHSEVMRLTAECHRVTRAGRCRDMVWKRQP